MIALFDNIKTKQVADLVGVNYKDVIDIQPGDNGDKFSITGDHFITSGAKGIMLPDKKQAARVTVFLLPMVLHRCSGIS